MTVFLDDGDVQLHHGDVIQTLRELPAGVAQTCVTSPPYWGLRDYGTGEWTGGDTDCEHRGTGSPDRDHSHGKILGTRGEQGWNESRVAPQRAQCSRCGARRVDSQIGLEATPDLYVERMVAVFREVRRVLRDDGTVWLNLGDSYVSDPGKGGSGTPNGRNGRGEGYGRDRRAQVRDGKAVHGDILRPFAVDGLAAKNLIGIPWRVAFALQADGWYLRSDIVWSKPNPMPESVTDRPTKAHEYLFLLSKRPRYFYDADAIREPHVDPERGANGQRVGSLDERPEAGVRTGTMNNIDRDGAQRAYNAAGRNRRSVWTVPTEPFPEAHFATYPQALVRPCIQAGTSEHGECSSCGAPWVREVEREAVPKDRPSGRGWLASTEGIVLGRATDPNGGLSRSDYQRAETTGWRASCACDAPTRPQTVLDPFIGSGTTALVARNHARRCIGIDLSAEYLAIAAKRLQQLSLLA